MSQVLPIQTLEINSVDELVDLFRQGYRLDPLANTKNTGNVVTMATPEGVTVMVFAVV